MAYFSGQGKLFIAERDTNGKPKAFADLGNCPDFEIELATSTVEHKESRSGQRLTDVILQTDKKASMKLTLEDFTLANLAKALYGDVVTISGGSVADATEVLPSSLVVGDYVRLDYGQVSSLVIKDSTGTPVTLTLDTHYSIVDAKQGLIKILSLSGVVQPLKAGYTYAATSKLRSFTQPRKDYWIRFAGVNTADEGRAVIIDLFKVQMNPAANLGVINDAIAQLQLTGGVLFDDLRPATGAEGVVNHGNFLSMELLTT